MKYVITRTKSGTAVIDADSMAEAEQKSVTMTDADFVWENATNDLEEGYDCE